MGLDEWGGGGILIGGVGGSPKIYNCVVVNNHSPEGAGGIRAGGCSDISIMNTIVACNTGDAGIHFNDSQGSIVNCTVTGNPGGGFGFHNSQIAVINCIEWNNNMNNWGNLDNINYSNIEEGAGGTGNIAQNPLFINDSNGDYHLQQGSPCIDAGDPDTAYNDIDGTRNDMGAFGGPGGETYVYEDGPPIADNMIIHPVVVAPGNSIRLTGHIWDAVSTVRSVHAESGKPR